MKQLYFFSNDCLNLVLFNFLFLPLNKMQAAPKAVGSLSIIQSPV